MVRALFLKQMNVRFSLVSLLAAHFFSSSWAVSSTHDQLWLSLSFRRTMFTSLADPARTPEGSTL